MSDHAGRARHWRSIGTNEGPCLVDTVGLRECVGRELDSLEDVRAAFVEALELERERCPHDLPLWIDLAVGEPFEPRPGFRIGDGFDLLAGPAMGSGRSPWTRAGLEAIERCRPADAVVADVGTGSGILGLYAAWLGARRVDAVDVDPLAVAVARRNARVNRLRGRFDARVGTVEALHSSYDLVMLSPSTDLPLEGALARVAARLDPGGTLVISPVGGDRDLQRAEQKARALRLEPVDRVDVEGWQTLVVKRGRP